MRIWINDTQLDTYESSVSVTKTNNLWKFGKAEFVHTQAVKIPATNNNKALLDFADEFRTQSSVARGFVDCLVDVLLKKLNLMKLLQEHIMILKKQLKLLVLWLQNMV